MYLYLWQNLAYKVRAQGDYFDDYAFPKLDNRGKMYLLPSICWRKKRKISGEFSQFLKDDFTTFSFFFIVHKMPENRGLKPLTLCEMNMIFLDHLFSEMN